MSLLRNVIMFGFLLALAGASAHAQARADRMVVNIPFNFSLGHETFSAGEYVVRRIGSSGSGYSIERTGGEKTDYQTAGSFLVNKVETGRAPAEGRLVFSIIDGRHRLTQVWEAGSRVGGELSGAVDVRGVAQKGAAPQTVTVVAWQR